LLEKMVFVCMVVRWKVSAYKKHCCSSSSKKKCCSSSIFKFIHRWQKRRAHTTEMAKYEKSKSKSKWGSGEGGGEGLQAVPVSCSMLTRIVFISRRLDCMSRSVCLLVMPHSATSSVRGDEISSTLSWNSGV